MPSKPKKRSVEERKLGELEPAEWNPRRISDDQLSKLQSSLERLGDLSGIIWNRRSERLVGGHQRKRVLDPDADIHIEKSYDKPTRTGTIAEGWVECWDERFTYREVDWSETDERIANVAANQHGGSFDWDKVSKIVQELDELDVDLDSLGFDDDDINAFLAKNFNETDDSEDEEEENEEAPSDEYDDSSNDCVCPKCGHTWSRDVDT